jgi:leader peptidase (prepilin peptidase)/N-methyltransferase
MNGIVNMMETYYLVMATLFGLLIGSFLNVVIYRVPAKRTLMGRSYCPKCNHLIRGIDNIPVLSWLALGKKCRDCKAPISFRYPAVELFTAFAWMGVTFWALQKDALMLLPLLLILASASIALAMIDFDTMTLPNRITYPLFILTAIYLPVAAIAGNQMENLVNAGIGALIYGGFFFMLWFLTGGRGLGFGDVKLSPTLGALIGWFAAAPGAIVALASAFIIGGLPAGILMAMGVIKRGTPIPFGPMLILGAWVGTLFGPEIADLYLTVSGLA